MQSYLLLSVWMGVAVVATLISIWDDQARLAEERRKAAEEEVAPAMWVV